MTAAPSLPHRSARNPSRRSASELLRDARAQEQVSDIGAIIAAYGRTVRMAERTQANAVLAEALRRLAVVHHRANHSVQARQLCARSYSAACLADNAQLAAEAMNTMGGINLETNAVGAARQNFLLALELGGNCRGLRARVEQNLGILANIEGDFDEARARYDRSLESYRESQDEHGCAIAYHNLGMVSAERRQWEDADRYFHQSFEIARRLSDAHLQGLCLLNHAETSCARGEYNEARRMAQTAVALLQHRGGAVRAQAQRVMGMAHREMGQPALAQAELQSSIELAMTAGSALNEAAARRELAILYQSMGRNREALTLLNDAHALFKGLNARAQLVHVAGRMAELEATYLEVVSDWGRSIESSDTYTFGHCERVATLALAVAQALQLDLTAQTTIQLGAYLHDLGKMRVPARILSKPGELTADEIALVRGHTVWGIELLAGIELPWDLNPIVRWHHERYDGTGYPDGLRGDEIPLTAQVVAIADVFDALTTARPYKKALPFDEALTEIERCQTWWSPSVYAAFLKTLTFGPPTPAI